MQVEIHDNSARIEMKKEKQKFVAHVSGAMQFPEIGIVFGTGQKWYKPFLIISLWYIRINIGWLF